jgi:hypothetical protein
MVGDLAVIASVSEAIQSFLRDSWIAPPPRFSQMTYQARLSTTHIA